jgi:transcriptional regulator with XRE-family HTH domain
MARRVTSASVGQRIKLIRGDLTQTEFAKILGIKKQNYISRYESGRIPAHEILVKIAEQGGVTVDWLLTGKLEGKKSGFETRETSPVYGLSRIDREINEIYMRLKPEDKKVLLRLLKGLVKGGGG